RRSGQAQPGGCAFHLSCRRSRPFQQHRELRDEAGSSVDQPFDDSEGGKMNLLGKLTWSAIPYEQPIIMAATAFMALLVGSVLLWVTLMRAWPYLWREWLTSVDHKRIGVMYLALALLMLVRGFTDAIMMRTQQAVAAGDAQGYLPPEHFDQIFSAHG